MINIFHSNLSYYFFFIYYSLYLFYIFFFFFNDPPTPEIYTPLYTLSLHDALPICQCADRARIARSPADFSSDLFALDRSEEHTSELQSHSGISYAVCCVKKKKIRVRVDGGVRWGGGEGGFGGRRWG